MNHSPQCCALQSTNRVCMAAISLCDTTAHTAYALCTCRSLVVYLFRSWTQVRMSTSSDNGQTPAPSVGVIYNRNSHVTSVACHPWVHTYVLPTGAWAVRSSCTLLHLRNTHPVPPDCIVPATVLTSNIDKISTMNS